ncbi:hypothetical protein LTR85_007714 [Meristemomyces frigidus]|nr:hypothetical protein LTR85_007714 [Meristemomyces frigidus]
MSSSLSAALAWAMPVRPDVLGAHLEAYGKALPVIHALRLCHRFGKGPAVYITKIPVEIEQAIEELILDNRRTRWDSWSWSEWRSEFRCFESQCEPAGHMEELSPFWDAAHEQLETCKPCTDASIHENVCENRCTDKTAEPCDVCKAEPGSEDCERACLSKFDDEVNEVCLRGDYWYEVHDHRQDEWRKRINQSAKGGFAKCDKILRKHFGLEAYFADTRPDTNHDDRWPEHKNYRWHGQDERQTTLCYLTFPRQAGPDGNFSGKESDMMNGYVSIPCAQAVKVDLPTVTDSTKMRTRFRRALRLLDLKPSMHPSQDHGCVISAGQAEEGASDGDVGSLKKPDKNGNGKSLSCHFGYS